jgi:hypothetical protein
MAEATTSRKGKRVREDVQETTYAEYVERTEKRRPIVMSLLTAYNASEEPNKIPAEIFMSLYANETDSQVQAVTRKIRHEYVTIKNKFAIGENIRNLHEMIDANNSITVDDPLVKTIFQKIATLINDHNKPANASAGGKKSKRKSKRNSSKRANKKKKTIKSKSKRRPRTRNRKY